MQQRTSIDKLFEEAKLLVSALPVLKDENSFYGLPDVGETKKRRVWELAAEQLLELASEALDDKKFYFQFWAADVFIGLGDCRRALQSKPTPRLGSRRSMQMDRILSLKHELGEKITGQDVAALFGPKLTKFGRDNIEDILAFLDPQIEQIQQRDNLNLLEEWAKDAQIHPHGMALFNGHASHVLAKYPTEYLFSLSPSAEKLCVSLMREAENTFREERDIPRVGEGWISETALFYEVRDALRGETVIQHGRPKWLGRQHLDVYIPGRNVALEFQGEQHDRPVEFFGGEAAFLKNKDRDRRKLARCRKYGVRIIYVREGYDLKEVIDDILSNSS